ncbi:MAG: hypothetical protein IT532_10095 [Burkholderiales bacterium]|nr:hypothetical protein [Burkholderiales bacterium]
MKRLAGLLTLAAGALILLALPLVIGATQNVLNERFTSLMLAALLACVIALVLTRLSHRLMRGHPDPEAPRVRAPIRDDRPD